VVANRTVRGYAISHHSKKKNEPRSGEKSKNRIARHYKKRERPNRRCTPRGGWKVQTAQTRARFDPLDSDKRHPIKEEVFSTKKWYSRSHRTSPNWKAKQDASLYPVTLLQARYQRILYTSHAKHHMSLEQAKIILPQSHLLSANTMRIVVS
jgi:hypothetical protein